MSQGPAAQRFFKELITLVNTTIKVSTDYDKSYQGNLKGYDPISFNLCLEQVVDNNDKSYDKIFIMGNHILEITPSEKPFDLKALSEELNRIFPNGVKLDEEAKIITILNKVKVTKALVEGPDGPIIDRVKKIHEQFVARSSGN